MRLPAWPVALLAAGFFLAGGAEAAVAAIFGFAAWAALKHLLVS